MKTILKTITLALGAAVFLSACTFKGSMGTSNIDITKVNVNEVKNMKKGEACSHRLLFFPLKDDATAITAAEEAGIKTIKYQEYKYLDLIVYGKVCAVVYGE